MLGDRLDVYWAHNRLPHFQTEGVVVHDPGQGAKEGISKGIANSILIKINQIGTLTETYIAEGLRWLESEIAPPAEPDDNVQEEQAVGVPNIAVGME